MIDLGTVKPGSTIRIPFSTFDKDDGSSITVTNYAAADMLVYKDGNTTERASTAGFTATTDFDTKTGKQLAIIDLADNTTADFWAAGSEYLLAIDAVTVDTVTTGGWIARWRIGYPGAILDTTIATLSTQTSFTLTTGPAEDDALNGMWCVIHDAASAVQATWVEVLDYTGATKTVTLAAAGTFTVAAKDNISFMSPSPLRPLTTGRTLQVEADNMAYADAREWLGGTIATPTVTGVPEVDVTHWRGTATPAEHTAGYPIVTVKDGTGTGEINTNAGAIALVDTLTTYTGNTPQTGDCFARLTGTGAVTFASLTVTGATVLTGNVSMAAGLTVTQSTANGHGVSITGNGTGHGVQLRSGSGATGNGMDVAAASTTGHGVLFTGTNTSGCGMRVVGGGPAIRLLGGAVGAGIDIVTTDGVGINILAVGTNKHGVWITGGSNGVSHGIQISAGTGGKGINTDSVNTTGTVSLDALTVTNATTLSGAVSLGSTLGVTGAITATNAANNLRLGTLTVDTNAIAWNTAWDAEVQSEVDDALVERRIDDLSECFYDLQLEAGRADIRDYRAGFAYMPADANRQRWEIVDDVLTCYHPDGSIAFTKTLGTAAANPVVSSL